MLDISKIKRRIFHLTVEDTQALLDKYIKPNFPDITYSVTHSKTTESIYIDFRSHGERAQARLSTHPPKNPNSRYHYISFRTRVPKVVRICVNTIKVLRARIVDQNLKKVGEENVKR